MTIEGICATIKRETGQTVTGATLIDSLEVDSLEFLNLLLVVSGEAGKDIPDNRIPALRTVADIAAELA